MIVQRFIVQHIVDCPIQRLNIKWGKIKYDKNIAMITVNAQLKSMDITKIKKNLKIRHVHSNSIADTVLSRHISALNYMVTSYKIEINIWGVTTKYISGKAYSYPHGLQLWFILPRGPVSFNFVLYFESLLQLIVVRDEILNNTTMIFTTHWLIVKYFVAATYEW